MKQQLSVIFFFLLVLTGRAVAQDSNTLCLYCEEPNKTYRCSVIGSGQINSKITKLYCLIKTAKEQNHARCRVKQTQDKLCVGGVEVTYLYEGPNIPGLTTKVDENDALTKQSRQNARVKARHEPSTLVELTQKSLGKTQKNLKKAGDNTQKAIKKTGKVIGQGAKNIGGAVKGAGSFLLNTTTTAVKCIFTLFNKCDNKKAINNTVGNENTAQDRPPRNDNLRNGTPSHSRTAPEADSTAEIDRQIILENKLVQHPSTGTQPSSSVIEPSSSPTVPNPAN